MGMGRPTARLVALVMMTAGLLVTTDGAATAHIEMNDYVVLPQTGHGDVVRLPGTPVLAIAGGDDSPVALVDVAERTVRTVPGTEGVRTLDLDQDGSHLHGVSRSPDEVVEIAVGSGDVTRRWPITDACNLMDVVMRGGSLWVSQGCGTGEIRRLDPSTGALSPTTADGETLAGTTGSPDFYALDPSTAGTLKKWTVTANGLAQLDSGSAAGIFGDLHLSEDGGTLFVRDERGFGASGSTYFWDSADLTASVPSWPSNLVPTWSDGIHVGLAMPSGELAGLATQDTRSVVNSFLPAEGLALFSADDVRLVGDVLAVTGQVGPEKRLYVVADPLLEAPEVTLDVPWGRTGLDTPTPVNGTMRRGGAPVPGQELQLVQLSPTRRDLGTVVTDAEGNWSTEWRPDQVGNAVLEVRYVGERDSVARERLAVVQDYYRIDATGPTEVKGGDPIAVTFRATHNGRPMEGLELNLERHRLVPYRWEREETSTELTDARGEVTMGVTAGAVDRYDFVASTVFPDGVGWREAHQVDVERTPTILTQTLPPRTAVPGDPVPLSLILTTAEGQPLAGQQVRFGIDPMFGSHPTRWMTATTDDEGRATVVDSATEEGLYYIEYIFDGTVEYDDDGVGYDSLRRARTPTTLSVEGNATGEVGVPITLQGTLAPSEGPVELTLRDHYTGEITTTTTDAAGSWSAQVTPTLPGPNSWLVSFAGTSRLAPTSRGFSMNTPRATSTIEDLTITNARYFMQYGLRGRLVGPEPGVVPLSISWDGGDPRRIYTADDGTFNTWGPSPTPGAHVVKVSYSGDHRHAPTEQELQVDVAKGYQDLWLEGPSMAPVGKSFEVVGHIRYFDGRSTELTVTSPDGAVTKVPIRARYPGFRFQLEAPKTPGEATWEIEIPGTETFEADAAAFTTYVAEPHDVEFIGGGTWHEPGDNASVLIRVPGSSSPEASIQVVDAAGSSLWSWTGTIPDEGLIYPTTLHDAQRVRVTVLEDGEHHTTTATYFFRLLPRLSTRLTGSLDRVGKYAVYGIRQDPGVATVQEPFFRRYADRCMRHIFQKLTPRGWETVRYPCAEADEPRLVSTLDWPRRSGARYRVKHRFYGDNWYLSTQGPWHYFRFR